MAGGYPLLSPFLPHGRPRASRDKDQLPENEEEWRENPFQSLPSIAILNSPPLYPTTKTNQPLPTVNVIVSPKIYWSFPSHPLTLSATMSWASQRWARRGRGREAELEKVGKLQALFPTSCSFPSSHPELFLQTHKLILHPTVLLPKTRNLQPAELPILTPSVCLTSMRGVIVQTGGWKKRLSLFLLPRIDWDLQVTYLDSTLILWFNKKNICPFSAHLMFSNFHAFASVIPCPWNILHPLLSSFM